MRIDWALIMLLGFLWFATGGVSLKNLGKRTGRRKE
jgi:hypothetical protein